MKPNFSKYIYIILLVILAIGCVCLEYKNQDKYQVLEVISPSEIYIDLNKNGQIDDDELITVDGIKVFEPAKTDNSNLTTEEKVYLAYKAKKWAKDKLKNKYVKIKNQNNTQIIYFNNIDYAQLIISEGLTYYTKPEYKKFFDINKSKTICKDIENKQLILVNKKSKKYHKLDCEFGLKSQNYEIIPLKLVHDETKKCKACFVHTKEKQKYLLLNNDIKIPKFESYKKVDNIEIYFIDFFNTKKPNDNCDNNACKRLLSEINQANKSIDFAIYGIKNQPKILNALINAHKRGVSLRWISDVDTKGNTYYDDNSKLEKAVPTFQTDKNCTKNYIMHNKFFVFDNQKVWTGSSNITDTDFSSFNANYNVLITSQEIANIYATEFNQMYEGKFHTGKTADCKDNSTNPIRVFFSPQDKTITNQIIPLINESKTYVYIPIFYLTHKQLSEALIKAKQRGIDVRLIIDATNSHGKYTIHHDLRNVGIPVKVENYAGKMHMKSIIIDDMYSVIGSMNLTKSGENNNDENTLVIKNPQVAKYLKYTFLTLWNSIPDKYLKFDPRAESFESIGSCFDGIDNNFDSKIDKLDVGCIKK